MGTFKEIKGDLIQLALAGEFDVIAQGNNCFCTQGSGIAPQFVKAFNTNDIKVYTLEDPSTKGDVNKMGQIQSNVIVLKAEAAPSKSFLNVVNCYTQFGFGRKPQGDLDYEALTLCMRKIGSKFHGNHIGLPLIGCGLAGGDWERVSKIIQHELRFCDVTIVHYDKGSSI